jgi:hypothetical protein
MENLPAQLMRRKDAAQFLRERFGIGSPATLAKLATIGGGPRYRKMGRVPLYDPADLDAWARARIGGLRASTSDEGAAA